MSETSNPYDIRDYERQRNGTVEIGEILEFYAGRHVAVHRVNTTGSFHWESLIYHLNDLAVDPETGQTISELRPSDMPAKHMTGGLAMGGSHTYTWPTHIQRKIHLISSIGSFPCLFALNQKLMTMLARLNLSILIFPNRKNQNISLSSREQKGKFSKKEAITSIAWTSMREIGCAANGTGFLVAEFFRYFWADLR